MTGLEGALTSLVGLENVLNPLPADEVPPGSNVLRATIPAVDVISMLPDINDKESLALALNGRVAAVVAALNAKLAILTKDEEDPTTSKVADSRSGESLLEFLHAAEAGIDLLLEVIAHFVSSLVLSSSHAEPIEVVVEELASLIAKTTSGGVLHDLADGLILEVSGSTSELSQLGSVALVVLLIVELDSLSRDVRLQGILGIGKFNSSVSSHLVFVCDEVQTQHTK